MTMVVGTDTLIVRHIPECLTDSEKVKFLEYFGAKEVRVMPHRGRMKHAAFATFRDNEDAKKAISRLHQVKMFDSVLSAEFAKELPVNHHKNGTTNSSNIKNNDSHSTLNQSKHSTSSKTDTFTEKKSIQKTATAIPIAPHLGLHYPSDPGIKYKYPPANGDILLNICSALATVPKFYVQVIHLMNKMHLIPPFSPTHTVPTMILDRLKEILPNFPQCHEMSMGNEPDKVEVVEMSESESEYESNESEGEDILKSLDMGVPERVVKSRKRKLNKLPNRSTKKKMTKLLPKATPIDTEAKAPARVSDAFDDSNVASIPKHIEIKVPSLPSEAPLTSTNPHSEGFGKFQPTGLTEPVCDDGMQKIPVSEEKSTVLKDFITLKQLSTGRLSEKEMKSSALYQNYKKGDPNCRLYIKNLSKRVTEKDLEFIYGSFVNYKNETESNMFDIQLLTQGRMKGQAFVGFSTVEAATAAMNATNGYQLVNKPMVVHYARSKKPKDQSSLD